MKRLIIQLTVSIISIILHFLYTNIDIYRATSKYGGAPFGDYLTTYTDRYAFLNGLTIALLLSFFVYIVFKYIETKNIQVILKACIVPLVILLVPGFFLGCFGPLTGVLIKKFGLFYEYMLSPFFLLLTIISTTIGYVKIRNCTRMDL